MLKLLFSVVQKYSGKSGEPIRDSIPVASGAGPQRSSINHGAAIATAAPGYWG
jgi:hypothetical protein